MSRYFVRNLLTMNVADTRGASMLAIYHRWLFWLAGWSEITVDADAAYANTMAIDEAGGANGFQVNASSPGIVYDPSGRFTQAMATNSYSLLLKATNAKNRGAWRIVKFIDANNVEIDPDGLPPWGWVTETGIPAKVIGGNTSGGNTFNTAGGTLAAAKSILVQAPSGNLQARVYYQDTSNLKVYARPKGGAAVTTEVGAGTTIVGYYDNIFRINCVFDDPSFLIYSTIDYISTSSFVAMWGQLTNADAADTDPGFIYAVRDITSAYPWNYAMQMLNGNPTPAAINAYPTYFKKYQGANPATNLSYNYATRKLINGDPGRAQVRRPTVVLDNVATYGACTRGKMPLIGFGNTKMEPWRPMDQGGKWLHLYIGLMVPRNGPNDKLPIL